MLVGIDINSKDDSGDTPLLNLCQLYRDHGHEITKRLNILIKFNTSLEEEDNNGTDVMTFLKDNDLFTGDDVQYWRPKKRQRWYLLEISRIPNTKIQI